MSTSSRSGAPHPMREVREYVIQSLYQWMMDPTSVATLPSRGDGIAQPDIYKSYIQGAIEIFPAAQEHIILKLSDGQWDRLHITEQAIMVLVVYELSVCHNTPYRVIINEAVELAKKYGGDESHRLVNGLADQLAITIRPLEVTMMRKGGRDDRSQ